MKILFFVGALLLTCATASFGGTLTCVEQCQHWDDFSRRCNYATRCEFGPEPNVLRYHRCEVFDDFYRRCQSETTQVTPYSPNFHAPAPACTESCQYFDSFHNRCLYRTRCEYTGRRVRSVRCEFWDEFRQRCYFEQSIHQVEVFFR